MTTVLHDRPRAGCYIADEASINLSRRVVVIASGSGVLDPGAVLGKITSSGKYAPHDPDASDGTQSAAAVLFDRVDATSADVEAVVSYASTAVNVSELIWAEGISQGEIAAAVAALDARTIVVLSATPAAPSIGGTQLVFVTPLPTAGETGEDIGPLQVRIENDEGLLVTGDNSTVVALAKTTGPGTLTGGGNATAVNGIATFTTVSLSEAGTVVLTASSSGLTSAVTGNIVISAA